jgi:ABC-2 type transport system permease protein
MIPGVLMLFIFLLTPYSIGTELKFKRSREWMKLADNNVHVAVLGKILPHFVIFLTIFYAFEFYIYYVLGFPHSGGIVPILLLGFLAVVSAQGFGIFVFGLMPSLRMSMSVCSLWAVLSLSVCGATYPLFAMDSVLVALGNLFPLRHYYMIYQMTIFNGYPMHYAALHFGALILFAALPILSVRHIKTAMLKYIYMP